MTKQTLTINWPALFSSEPFREGWRQARAGLPIDSVLHEGLGEVRPMADALYALGRCAAIEAPAMELPDRAEYFSISMQLLLSSCPEMHKEFKLSALRHFINPEQKNNVA